MPCLTFPKKTAFCFAAQNLKMFYCGYFRNICMDLRGFLV